MVEHRALGSLATFSLARVHTLLRDTRQVLWTFLVQNAFWPAVGRGTLVVGEAGAGRRCRAGHGTPSSDRMGWADTGFQDVVVQLKWGEEHAETFRSQTCNAFSAMQNSHAQCNGTSCNRASIQ